ncbi:hypothetical protein HYC85_018954 [Camellia sinensis]|uniref:Ribose-5-phosphate isomerase n=1 Tax=Camellia sinensis TaxID=4442 RepID=A0A7J7GWP5_CAMSI|nr:hypothetical protein HYC85_018954 [Camellia sinensis]
MAAVAAIIPSISTVNLHFQASLKKGLGLDSTRRRRRLNSLVSITRACLLHRSASLLESATKHTVDTFIKSGMVVGLGSGLASCIAIQYLGRQLRVGAIKDIVGISTYVGSASEAAKIDFAFNDADIIEERTLISLIGHQRLQGEESIIQEKILRTIWLSVLNRWFAWASDGPTHLIISYEIFDNYWDLTYDF